MSPRRRFFRRFAKAFLPILLVILVAFAGVMVWIVRGITRPPRAPYVVTPQTFSKVTGPLLNATDVTWSNHDETSARGWLIRGAEGAPAVILLHAYGADRSWLLNMAVKLNESTSFTVLCPDLRGHGQNPPVSWTLFGGVDGDDASAAIDYLRTLKTPTGKDQVGPAIGAYGCELGAYAALAGAARNSQVRALALDSVPASPDDLIRAVMATYLAMNTTVLQKLGRWGVKMYSSGKYTETPSCDLARSLRDKRVLLLSGEGGEQWRASTAILKNCFAGGVVELKEGLPATGLTLLGATGQTEEAYDRPVIEFFDKSLR
jgi:pimeloyl-ACP methyl ester carboxylesterase